jgi:hypothetical protein
MDFSYVFLRDVNLLISGDLLRWNGLTQIRRYFRSAT